MSTNALECLQAAMNVLTRYCNWIGVMCVYLVLEEVSFT